MKNLEIIEKNFILLNRYKETLKKNKEVLLTNNANDEEITKIEKEIEAIDNLMSEIQNNLNENNNEEEISNIDLKEAINEEEKEIENIRKQIDEILNDKYGAKKRFNYKGNIYYIPPRKKGKFIALMIQLDNLLKNKFIPTPRNRLDNETDFEYEQYLDSFYKNIYSKENNDFTSIPTPRNRLDNETDFEYEQYLDSFYREYYNDNFRSPNRFTEEEKINIEDKISTEPFDEFIDLNSTENIDEEEGPRIIEDDDEDELKIINEDEEEDLEVPELNIENVRKPKFKDRIKKILKKAIPIAIVAVLTIVGAKGLANKIKEKNNLDNKVIEDSNDKNNVDDYDYVNNNTQDKNEDERLNTIKKDENDINDENNYGTILGEDSSNKNQDIDWESIDNQSVNYDINLGSKVKLNTGSKIYKNAKDSMLEENQYNPYYNNPEEERVILGVSISQNGTIHNIFACTENAKEEINNLLNNGGIVESILTGNSSRIKELKKYDGTTRLSANEINNLAEGWYNINSVAFNNEKGLTL